MPVVMSSQSITMIAQSIVDQLSSQLEPLIAERDALKAERDALRAQLDAVPVDAIYRIIKEVFTSTLLVQSKDLEECIAWLQSQGRLFRE